MLNFIGVFGGTVHEPMTDLIKVMGTLVNTDGKITIPGLYEMVQPLTDEELARYKVSSSLFDSITH